MTSSMARAEPPSYPIDFQPVSQGSANESFSLREGSRGSAGFRGGGGSLPGASWARAAVGRPEILRIGGPVPARGGGRESPLRGGLSRFPSLRPLAGSDDEEEPGRHQGAGPDEVEVDPAAAQEREPDPLVDDRPRSRRSPPASPPCARRPRRARPASVPPAVSSAAGAAGQAERNEHRHQHQPGAVRRRHQERPDRQPGQAGPHADAHPVAVPAQRMMPAAQADQRGPGGDLAAARWSTISPSSTTASATASDRDARGRARSAPAPAPTTRRLGRCRPSATANSQPIAGLMPWKAPSPASTSHGDSAPTDAAQPSSLTGSSRNPTSSRRPRAAPGAAGAPSASRRRSSRRRRCRRSRLTSSFTIQPVDALGIELRIDRAVERVGEIDPPAVAADLDHLRPAVQRPVLRPDAPPATTMPPILHLAGQLRVERIGHVVLLHVAGAPAGDVEEAVVHRQVDVGDERRHRLEALQQRRQVDLGRPARPGSRSPSSTAHLSPSRYQVQIDDDRSLRLITQPTKP